MSSSEMVAATAVNAPDHDDWEADNPDRIGRLPYSLIRQARLDLFRHTDILDEHVFDATFAEHKLPNISRRTAEQTVPVTSIYPETTDFYVTCKIADPIDAAILLNAREPDVVLQALEALIAFVEDRLGQFRNDTADETNPTNPSNPSNPTNTSDKRTAAKRATAASLNDAAEGDEYLKNTLIQYPGFLKRVVQLISSSYRSLRRRAVILFGSLSEIEEAVEQFDTIPWLPKIASLIKSGTEAVVLDWAVLALKNLSISKLVQDEIFAKGLIDPLLDLVTLDGQDPDVIENLMQTLCRLSAHGGIREHLALNGGFEPAVEQALSEFPSTQYYALRLMRELLCCCGVEGVVDRFHEADGMATVVSILGMEELRHLHASTLEVLEYLMGIPWIAHELSQKRMYEFLLDRALSKDYQGVEDVQTFAIRAVSRAASFPDQRLIMNNRGVEGRLMQLITLSSYLIQAAALQAIGNLAKTVNCRRKLRELNVVKVVAKHLDSFDPAVREQAFFAAGTLMLYEAAFVEAFQKEEFLRLLHVTLTDLRFLQMPGLVNEALACVINLSETVATREAMAGFVVKLIPVWLSQPDEAVKIKALLCAGIFVHTDHDRSIFTQYNGYPALGNLLKPPVSDNLIRHACWAISLLAVHRAAIIDIARSGCIYPLLDARRASNPVTRGYAHLALRRLTSLHLPFKYALYGELGPDDRIQHGFYDTGPIIGRAGFRSLKSHFRTHFPSTPTVIFVSLPRKRFVEPVQTENSTEFPVSRSPDLAVVQTDSPIKAQTPENDGQTTPPSSPDKSGKVRKTSKLQQKSQSETTKELNNIVEERVDCKWPVKCSGKEAGKQPTCKPVIPKDAMLQKLIKKVLLDLKAVRTIREEITLISQAVAEHMGGPGMTSETVHKHFQELSEARQSNCIAIGDVNQGVFCHRALLFKVLADRIHLPVTLIRGKNERGWNEVHLMEDGSTTAYVVDLMGQVGQLLLKDSPEAVAYTDAPTPVHVAKQISELTKVKRSTQERQGTEDEAVACRNTPSLELDEQRGKANKLEIRGSAITIKTGSAVESAIHGQAKLTDKGEPQRTTNIEPFINPGSSLVRKTILCDMEAARELRAQKQSTTAAVLTAKGVPPTGPTDTKPKDLKTEPRAPFVKWRPKSSHADRDAACLASIPRELPSLLHIFPSHTKTNKKQKGKTSKKSLWDPLRSRTSLETDDIWDGAPEEDTAGGRRETVLPPSAYDLLADAESEEIPEGYDPKSGVDRWDELTFEEQNTLERWEMDLEDDEVDDQVEEGEEAEDVIMPADGVEKTHPAAH